MGLHETLPHLPTLLMAAWLLPLLSFTLIVFLGPSMGKAGVKAGYVATGAIFASAVLSFVAFVGWVTEGENWDRLMAANQPSAHHAHEDGDHHKAGDADSDADSDAKTSAGEGGEKGADGDVGSHGQQAPRTMSGEWYSLAQFGTLKIGIGYYIDTLTVCMFCMVTVIATCIHVYAMGYMHEELHDVTDPEVTLPNGEKLKRPGRYHRFFQYLSLFCFSMLGVVIAGNIAMTFVFWELVGICSYFLIGFYYERHSASTAANKAFIVNRIGDFGMIIGLMAIWSSLGTFSFGDMVDEQGNVLPGVFSQVRSPENDYQLQPAPGMVQDSLAGQPAQEGSTPGYGLLIVAGLGIFCGCVGKSAQFPLHTWLPDAMEGPTPVSALVHSATMVAAGVFLVGRFYPVFTPEVLLVIAVVGCATLFMAATIAITATDIKRVLAYSTVSQLGYMMLALGVGGWTAGMFHLITHAFFKSLLFLGSGSVIHAVHTNEMTEMGGLRKKMPYTAYTMLIGCLAIIGAGLPFLVGFSGYYSKDSIIAQTLSFSLSNGNPFMSVFFYAAAGGAAITAFYMFRLWFMTFCGPPRNQHRYDHAHESPREMYVPLIVLSVFAVGVGWSVGGLNITALLETARPAGTLVEETSSHWVSNLVFPNEHVSHHDDAIHTMATIVAFSTAMAGLFFAAVVYLLRKIDPREIKRYFAPVYYFLLNKWWFDELYNAVFVQPTHVVSNAVVWVDRTVLDGVLHGAARITKLVARIEDLIDRLFVDGLVNVIGRWTYNVGVSLKAVQTGRLRQYVVFIVIGTVALFVLASFFLKFSMAG